MGGDFKALSAREEGSGHRGSRRDFPDLRGVVRPLIWTQQLMNVLKKENRGPSAKKILRFRTEIQLADSYNDPLTKRLVPVIDKYKDRLKGRLLDVGCYTGFLYHHLGKPEGYSGIDIWPEVVEVAKEFYPEADFRVQNLMDVNESFDVVWSSQILWYKTEVSVEKAMEKIKSMAPKYLVAMVVKDMNKLGVELPRIGELYICTNLD